MTRQRSKTTRRWGPGILTALAVGLAVFGFVLIGDDGASSSDRPSGTEPAPRGEAAVDFTLTLFDGTEFNLREHLSEDGRPVFLNFWASWCPPCRAEMPDISASAERHPEVLFLGIAVSDTREAAAAYADEVAVSYPLGFDATGTIEAHYPAPGLPATFLISSRGEIIGTHVGQVRPEQIEQLVGELLGS